MFEHAGGLDDHLKDVPLVSSTDNDDYVEDELELENDELETDADDQDSDGDQDQDDDKEEKKSGRNLDNIYRELARKQEDFQERMQRQYSSTMQELTSALRDRPVQPVQQDGDSLDSMSIDKLKSMRSNVPEEQRVAFDDYLQERIIITETDKRMEAFSQTQSFDLKRRDANLRATERYPELRNRESEFHTQVDTELRARGTDYAKTNPNAVLDVSNSVAVDMGLTMKPKDSGGTRRTFVRTSATRKNARPVNTEEESTLSDEKAQAIKTRLEANIPGLKIDLDRVKKKHKLYKDNQDLFVK